MRSADGYRSLVRTRGSERRTSRGLRVVKVSEGRKNCHKLGELNEENITPGKNRSGFMGLFLGTHVGIGGGGGLAL